MKTPGQNYLRAITIWVLVLAEAMFSLRASEPTRAEFLKGGLGPERTCYDVTAYHLDVRIDPAAKTISGSNKITSSPGSTWLIIVAESASVAP